MTATLMHRNGRTFKIERGKSGDATGWMVFELNLEPGITWSSISGAYRLKRDAIASVV